MKRLAAAALPAVPRRGAPAHAAAALLALLALAAPAHAASVLDDPAAFRDPPRDVRPKFRWWWGNFALPSSLDPAAVRDELKAMADAGFGGAEIGFTPSVW